MATASIPASASSPREPLDVRARRAASAIAAVREHALGHVEAQMARHERLRQFDHQVVEVVAVLAPDLERVAEALRRDQRGRGRAALDDRVGHERRAMDDQLEVARRSCRDASSVCASTVSTPSRRVVRRGQRLVDGDDLPSSARQRSVKVPPMSTPARSTAPRLRRAGAVSRAGANRSSRRSV